MKAARLILIALVFLMAQGGFLLHLADFSFSPTSEYSDIAISHYANAVFLRQSLVRYSEIPLWSNAILSGYPFFADPLSGIHYPLGWLALFFPLPFGFNFLISLHLLLGAFGFYFFFRQRQTDEKLAVLGGLCFSLIPRFWAHLAAGHLTMLYAVCWTPWLLLASGNARFRSKGLPGLVLGIIILADIRWAGYITLPWLLYYVFLDGESVNIVLRSIRRGLSWIGQGLVGILIGAVLLIPLFELTPLSNRGSLSMAERTVFSLPPQQFLALLFPDFHGNVELIVYPGTILILAYLWSWLDPIFRSRTRLLRWIILLSYLFCLGSNSFLTSLLFALPIFSFLRVPSRLALVANIFLIVLFILWMDYLIKKINFEKIKAVRLGLVGFCAIEILFTSLVWVISPMNVPINLIWGCVASVVATFILFIYINKPRRGAILVLIGIALIDLLGVNFFSVSYRSREQVLGINKDLAMFLSEQEGTFRVYSPSYSIPQQVAADYGLQLADGINPLQLQSYVNFMKTAAGCEGEGYSVTLPPFPTGNPKTDNQSVILESQKLGILNIRFITAEFDIQGEGLVEVQRFGSTRVYANLSYQSRAWMLSGRGLTGLKPIADEVVVWSPNRIQIKTEGAGLLVLSEISYPGWRAKIDGQQVEIQTFQGLFRSVELSEGSHQVVFELVPMSFYLGLIISLISIVILFLWNWRKRAC